MFRILALLLLCPFGLYAQTSRLVPEKSVHLDRKVSETSGLATWNGNLLTHNDSGNSPALFVIDTLTGKILNEFSLPATNSDWEDIAQDSSYFYIADVGNNRHSRFRLKIYRVEKESLLQGQIALDTIFFEWEKNRGEAVQLQLRSRDLHFR